MSLTSKQHKESTESCAVQGMHNSPMGVPPEGADGFTTREETEIGHS